MNRVALLGAALLMFMVVPWLVRSPNVPPRWRVRLGFLALMGMLSTLAVLLAAILLPEVLWMSSAQQVWQMCSAAFRAILGDPLARWPSLLGGAALGILFGRFCWSLVLGARASRRAMIRGGEPTLRLAGGQPVFVVPMGRLEAYSVGSVRGQVVVSSALLAALEEEERRAVLLHEEAHLRSGHQWMLVIARAAVAALKPVAPAHQAMALLEQAVEESADEYAAAKLGSAATVASSISRAALAGLRSPAGAVSLGSGPDVTARVRRLVAPPKVPRWVPVACLGAAGTLLGLFAVTQALGGLALLAAAHHVVAFGTATMCPLARTAGSHPIG